MKCVLGPDQFDILLGEFERRERRNRTGGVAQGDNRAFSLDELEIVIKTAERPTPSAPVRGERRRRLSRVLSDTIVDDVNPLTVRQL